jgi:hypothetical protein
MLPWLPPRCDVDVLIQPRVGMNHFTADRGAALRSVALTSVRQARVNAVEHMELDPSAAIFIAGWTCTTQNELAFLSSLCAGGIVLCKLLSGSSDRLCATSKFGEFTRDSGLLPKFGISLAEACRAGARGERRPRPRERSSGYVTSARQDALYFVSAASSHRWYEVASRSARKVPMARGRSS